MLDVGPRSAVANVTGDTPVVIFDNIAGGVNPSGSAPASQLDSVFPFDAGAADDFTLGESPECLWSIAGVRFQGVYWNGSGPGAVSAFRVIFWPDTPDGPDGRTFGGPDLSMAAAVYEIPGNAGESSTAAPDIFAYEVLLPEPFNVVPHQRWWIQVQAVMPYPPQWGPAVTNTSQGETPYEYFDLLGLPPWMPIADAGDLAFQILGSPRSIPCDDGDACTTDVCQAGGCVHTAVGCDDGDACTTDSCDPASGCVNESIICDDGDPCTVDLCEGGVCQFIAPPDFDGDGDVDDSDAAVVLGCIVKGGGEGCECADLNGDGMVDLQDYSLIQREFTGAK